MLTWKIVGVSKVSILYLYIDKLKRRIKVWNIHTHTYIYICMYVCTMYVCIYKSNGWENEKNVEEKQKSHP